VLLLILASCVQLALDDNGVDPDSREALVSEERVAALNVSLVMEG
jgi:hypothetical protein